MTSAVCLNHFDPIDIITQDRHLLPDGREQVLRRTRPGLRKTAVPCLFDAAAQSSVKPPLTSTPAPPLQRTSTTPVQPTPGTPVPPTPMAMDISPLQCREDDSMDVSQSVSAHSLVVSVCGEPQSPPARETFPVPANSVKSHIRMYSGQHVTDSYA